MSNVASSRIRPQASSDRRSHRLEFPSRRGTPRVALGHQELSFEASSRMRACVLSWKPRRLMIPKSDRNLTYHRPLQLYHSPNATPTYRDLEEHQCGYAHPWKRGTTSPHRSLRSTRRSILYMIRLCRAKTSEWYLPVRIKSMSPGSNSIPPSATISFNTSNVMGLSSENGRGGGRLCLELYRGRSSKWAREVMG
jgi:hypothetical protein